MYKLDPLTKEMITQAETLFDVEFPDEYIKILSTQNGGYLLYDTYSCLLMPSYSSIEIQIDHLFGIGGNVGILDIPHFQEEWNLPKGVVLISGDGHEWVALDYRNSKANPPIVYVDSEEETITTIATSFNEFLTVLMSGTLNKVRREKLTSPLQTEKDF